MNSVLNIDFSKIKVTFSNPPKAYATPDEKSGKYVAAIADITIDNLLAIKGFRVICGESRTSSGEKQKSIDVRYPEVGTIQNKITTFWIKDKDVLELVKDGIWKAYIDYEAEANA